MSWFKNNKDSQNQNEYSNFIDESNDFDDDEGETTLLSEELLYGSNVNTGNYENGNIGNYAEEDDSYEGETTLLTQDDYEPVNREYNIGDEEEGTTLLATGNNIGYSSNRMAIPSGAPRARILRITPVESIVIDKVKFIIGSERGTTDYVVNNNAVSRKHAFIIFKDNKYFLIDNKSTNKTYVDGRILEPLEPFELYHGALLQLSDELFQFMLE